MHNKDLTEIYLNLNSIAIQLEDQKKLEEEVKTIFLRFELPLNGFISKAQYREVYLIFFEDLKEKKTYDSILKNFISKNLNEEEMEKTFVLLDHRQIGFLCFDKVKKLVMILAEKLIEPIIEKITSYIFEKYKIEKEKGLVKKQFKDFYFNFYQAAQENLPFKRKKISIEKALENAWNEVDVDNSRVLEFNEIKEMFRKIVIFLRKSHCQETD